MEPVIVKQEGLSSSFISTLMSTRTLSWPALDRQEPTTDVDEYENLVNDGVVDGCKRRDEEEPAAMKA